MKIIRAILAGLRGNDGGQRFAFRRTFEKVFLIGGCCLFMSGIYAQNAPSAMGVRIKDIASLRGARSNQLIGYGLVVGLEGTGDSKSSPFTAQAMSNMLERFGITILSSELKVKNVAAVMVTAELPPYARAGSKVDVVISSLGDARSLQGGTLLQTPLTGADGRVYAVAQGPLSIGGFNFSAGGNQVQKNHTTVGRIPEGALVENEVPSAFLQADSSVIIQLKQPDFTTASRIAQAIQEAYPGAAAQALDPGTVRAQMPPQAQNSPVAWIAQLETLKVKPDAAARVIVNERTGTIVVNGDVKIAPIAIAHGSLSIRIETKPKVSQPPPFSGGDTVVVPKTEIKVDEETARLVAVPEGASVESLAKALNALGVTPRDLIAILQALKSAGALYAEIVVQ